MPKWVIFWQNPHVIGLKIWQNTNFGALGAMVSGKTSYFTKMFRFFENNVDFEAENHQSMGKITLNTLKGIKISLIKSPLKVN